MRRNKDEVITNIMRAAEQILQARGTTHRLDNAGSIRTAEVGNLSLCMTTPFTKVSTGKGDYRYTLDIKDRTRSKKSPTVLAVGWEPAKRWADDRVVFTLKGGDWIQQLLSDEAAR